MSVVGFDLGYQSCIVAVARKGGIEVVANEHSDRATPSFVSFTPSQRFIGAAAKQQLVTNRKNTVYGVKKLLGRHANDPSVVREAALLPYKILAGAGGEATIEVQYGGETKVFCPEQITAMLLTRLKETASIAMKTKVTDCVIAVPCFFTDTERYHMKHAAEIAGLNCLRIFNETTAVALDYGIYKTDLPPPEEKARNVVFVDMGQAHTQVSAAALNKGQLKMLATVFDPALGGRDFDQVLVSHFVEDFKTRLRLDARTNERALIRLTAECEKLKKLMSANSTDLPINLECFMEDRDVSGRYSRSQLEEASTHLTDKFRNLLVSILDLANLKPADLYAVEIVGGSTRVPMVKQLIKECLWLEPKTTLNADEAVARGCALQCAMLSPTFVVREFKVTDCQQFPIRLDWDPANEAEDASLDLMQAFHAVPQSKLLTFYRVKPFSLRASYADPKHLPFPNPHIGTFYISDVLPKEDGKAVKVKVKGRVNSHGIFQITEASTTEKIELPVEPMEVDAETKDAAAAPAAAEPGAADQPMESTESETTTDSSTSASTSETTATSSDSTAEPAAADASAEKEAAPAPPVAEEKKKPAVPKTKVRSIELGVSMEVNRLPAKVVERLQELEFKMIADDRLEQERQNAKNSVEEYVYEMRGKVYESLEAFITEEAREKFTGALQQTEDWLYDEGENLHKQAYVDRLAELKKHGEPVVRRSVEAALRPKQMEAFARSITHVAKVLEQYAQGDEKYAHLEAEEMKKVEKEAGEKRQYYDGVANKFTSLSATADPPVLCQQIRNELDAFEKFCNPIISKAKPKPKEEPPKEEPPKDAEGAEAPKKSKTSPKKGAAPDAPTVNGNGDQAGANANNSAADSTAPPAASTDAMDLD